jgi:hypothetical protein
MTTSKSPRRLALTSCPLYETDLLPLNNGDTILLLEANTHYTSRIWPNCLHITLDTSHATTARTWGTSEVNLHVQLEPVTPARLRLAQRVALISPIDLPSPAKDRVIQDDIATWSPALLVTSTALSHSTSTSQTLVFAAAIS